jgi:succinate dehydrogenase/fumarate reductase flavoprotein subunit
MRPQELKQRVGEIMWAYAGIVRSEAQLAKGLEELQKLGAERMKVHGSRRYNLEWNDYIEVQNMLLVSEAVIRCALLRKESRGAHYRSDYPARDDTIGLVNYTCAIHGGEMETDSSPVVITRLLPTKRRGD